MRVLRITGSTVLGMASDPERIVGPYPVSEGATQNNGPYGKAIAASRKLGEPHVS